MALKLLRRLCLVFCLCFAGASVSATPFVSPRGYGITPPAGWHVDSSGSSGNDVVIFADKNSDSSPGTPAPNLNVRMGPQDKLKTLDIAKRGMIPAYRKGYPNLVLVSQTYSSVGGKPDLDTTVLVGSPGGLTRIHQVLVLKENLFTFLPALARTKFMPNMTRFSRKCWRLSGGRIGNLHQFNAFL